MLPHSEKPSSWEQENNYCIAAVSTENPQTYGPVPALQKVGLTSVNARVKLLERSPMENRASHFPHCDTQCLTQSLKLKIED